MVTIFTTPNCQGCRISKRRMDEKGVEYETVDLSEDAAAMEKVKALGHTSAPVIVAPDGTHWSGLRLDLIDALTKS